MTTASDFARDGGERAGWLGPTARYDVAAAIMSVAAFALALTVGQHHQVGTFGAETDFYSPYAWEAADLLAGKPFKSVHHTPGYPLLLAGGAALTQQDFFTIGKALSAVGLLIFGAMTYLGLRALTDVRIALAATVLCLLAALPFSYVATADLLAAAIMLVPIWLVVRRTARWQLTLFVAGLMCGIAYLIRMNALFLPPGIVLGLLLANPRRQRLRDRFAGAALVAAGFLAATAPWFAWNWSIHGTPLAGTAHLQAAAYYHPAPGDSIGGTARAAQRFESAAEVLAFAPLRMARKYAREVTYRRPFYLFDGVVGFPGYLFAGAGALLLLRRHTPRGQLFMTVCLVGYFLHGLVSFLPRYYLFLFPALFVVVTYALFHPDVMTAFRGWHVPRGAASWALVLGIAAFVASRSYQATTDILTTEPRHLIPIADSLRRRSAPDDLIIGHKPHLAYLAGLRRAFPDVDSTTELLTRARALDARYLTYSTADANSRPVLRPLADPAEAPADLQVLYRHQPSGTIIYEFRPGAGEAGPPAAGQP